jgi:hypothetical protein
MRDGRMLLRRARLGVERRLRALLEPRQDVLGDQLPRLVAQHEHAAEPAGLVDQLLHGRRRVVDRADRADPGLDGHLLERGDLLEVAGCSSSRTTPTSGNAWRR